MVNYTREELESMIEWQHDQLERQERVIKHLQEVIELYIKDEQHKPSSHISKEELNDGYVNDGNGWETYGT